SLALLPQVDARPLLGGLDPLDPLEQAFAPQLVSVRADLAQRNALVNSGLGVTEHAGRDTVEVVLHTPADRAVLESLGLPFEVRVPDLLRREAEIQEANRAYAAAVDRSPLPSGRDTYRTLEDYDAEMRALADSHPDLVKLIE